MKRFLLLFLAAIAGLVGGALVGVAVGLGITTVFKTSQFEGYAGYLVFTTFMPIGALIGLFVGPFLAARTYGPRKDSDAPAG